MNDTVHDTHDDILMVFLESNNKLLTINEMFENDQSCDKNYTSMLFRMMTSYVSGDFDENDTENFLIEYYELLKNISHEEDKQSTSNISLLVSEWSDYLCQLMTNDQNEKEKIFELLKKLLYSIKNIQIRMPKEKYNLIMTQQIWECECFRNVLHMFPDELCGDNYAFNGMFCSLFTLKKWEVDFNAYLEALNPIIQESSTHDFLINYIHKIVTVNIPHTYEDKLVAIEKHCSPFNFNMFVLKVLIKLIEYYSMDNIIDKINECEQKFTVKYDNITSLPLHHKLYFVTLYAIPVCHITVLREYNNLKSKLKYGLFITNKIRTMIKEEMTRASDLISKKTDYSVNSIVQTLYLSYAKVATKIENPEIFMEMVTYVDNATSFTSVENFYGDIDGDFYNMMSYICGGFEGLVKNVHVRHYACLVIFKLLDSKGFNAFKNLYENLFKYISEVDFFEWSAIDLSIDHQYKLVETIYFFTDNYYHEINGTRNVVAGTLYVLLKSSIKLFELIHDLCEYYKSKNMLISKNTILFQKMINTISMTLQIHQNVYERKIIKTVYPEVENKYSILIYELLKASTNINHELYTVLRRPDLAANITNVVYESISNHIDFCSEYLTNVKDIIVDNIMSYSKLPKERKTHIINKLATIKKQIDYPQEFLDPLMCTEIIDPVKIPGIDNEIFDKSGILTHIYDSKQNPYTREPLTVEILEEYNKQESVVQEINNFLQRKREFEENYQMTNNDM